MGIYSQLLIVFVSVFIWESCWVFHLQNKFLTFQVISSSYLLSFPSLLIAFCHPMIYAIDYIEGLNKSLCACRKPWSSNRVDNCWYVALFTWACRSKSSPQELGNGKGSVCLAPIIIAKMFCLAVFSFDSYWKSMLIILVMPAFFGLISHAYEISWECFALT